VPLLYRQFEDEPSTLGPFLALNRDLSPAVLANSTRHGEIQAFSAPVRFAFGEEDEYLSPAYGQALAALFPHSDVTPIAGAGHFPQLDEPEAVAEQILSTPTA